MCAEPLLRMGSGPWVLGICSRGDGALRVFRLECAISISACLSARALFRFSKEMLPDIQ